MLYVGAMAASSYLSKYADKLLKGENQSTSGNVVDWFPSFIKLNFRYAFYDWYPLFNLENPTNATAHAPEKTFQHKLQYFFSCYDLRI